MLSFALILAVCSTAFEMIVAYKWDWWRNKAAHNLLVCGVGSVLLSFVLGTAFGAHGLIAMTAGIISTVMSACCYPIMQYYIDNKDKITAARSQGHIWWAKNAQTFRDLGHLCMTTLRIMTFPFRAIRWLTEKYNQFHQPAQPINRLEHHP